MLRNLSKPCGTPVIPGIKQTIEFTIVEHLQFFPQTKAELGGTNPGDTMLIGEEFEFISGKSWETAPILVDTGEQTDNLEGDISTLTQRNGFNFYIVGNDSVRKEFVDMILCYTGCLIFKVPTKEGHYNIIGSFDYPAWVETGEGGTGGELSGFQYSVFSMSGKPSLVYDPTEIDTTATVLGDNTGNILLDNSGNALGFF